MVGREVADRICARGIAGELKRLAAAAAEIDLASIAAPARVRHPLRSPEALEEGRLLPDPGQRALAHGGPWKFEGVRRVPPPPPGRAEPCWAAGPCGCARPSRSTGCWPARSDRPPAPRPNRACGRPCLCCGDGGPRSK